jgi:hypothetical protein
MDTLSLPSMHAAYLPQTQNRFKLLSARISCIKYGYRSVYYLSQPVPVPRRLAAGAPRIPPRQRVSLALVLLRAVRAPLAAVRVLVWAVVFCGAFQIS